MNLPLTKTLTDITGQTGLAMTRAIVAGEWDTQALPAFAVNRRKPSRPCPKVRSGKNAPGVDVRAALREWAGIDPTHICGLAVHTALKVLVEWGPDLAKLKSAKHCCSWRGRCPGTRLSGGKRLSGASQRIANRVARALHLAAGAAA